MAHDLEIGPFHLGLWRPQQIGSCTLEPIVETHWDKFLNDLGLTESEALEAIARDGEAGDSIGRFVDNFSHNHFVPEDVLRTLHQRRKASKEIALSRLYGNLR